MKMEFERLKAIKAFFQSNGTPSILGTDTVYMVKYGEKHDLPKANLDHSDSIEPKYPHQNPVGGLTIRWLKQARKVIWG